MIVRYLVENPKNNLLFRCRSHHGGWYMPPHLHEFCEIIYCKEGGGEIVVNGNKMRLDEKQIAFIPPLSIHEFFLGQAETVCAIFSGSFIPLFSHELEHHKLIVSPIDLPELSEILDDLEMLCSTENNITVSGYLNLICGKVFARSQFETEISVDIPISQKVISYLANHYTDPISLSDLAKKFGYNEKYLSSQLHCITGIHFNTFLSLFRMEHAKMLLSSKNAGSVATIAYESGFPSIKTFNRVFKKNTGMTPLEYRKINMALHV